jgi:hypothetical protein
MSTKRHNFQFLFLFVLSLAFSLPVFGDGMTGTFTVDTIDNPDPFNPPDTPIGTYDMAGDLTVAWDTYTFSFGEVSCPVGCAAVGNLNYFQTPETDPPTFQVHPTFTIDGITIDKGFFFADSYYFFNYSGTFTSAGASATTPEPSSLVLLFLAIVACGMMRLRVDRLI